MKRGVGVICGLCFIFLSVSFIDALECPKQPEQSRKDWVAEVNAAVAKVGPARGADLKIRTQNAVKDLLGKLPEANKVYLEQMMYATYCSALRDDSKLSESEKANRVRAYNNEIRSTFDSLPRMQLPVVMKHKDSKKKPSLKKTETPQVAEITDKIIANFTGVKGSGAYTVFGFGFSMMSDSVHNMRSKIWYERIHDGMQSDGFLRLHYQIDPAEGREGFVGVYSDFTLPPPRPISLLKYTGMSIRMRIGQEGGRYPEVRFVLYSDNIKNSEFAHPITRIQPEKEWKNYNMPFSKFELPPHSLKPVQLDPGRVFRFGVVLVSDTTIHGYIDVDDIQLFL